MYRYGCTRGRVGPCPCTCMYMYVHACTCTITVSERKLTGLERGSRQSTVLVALVCPPVSCRLLARACTGYFGASHPTTRVPTGRPISAPVPRGPMPGRGMEYFPSHAIHYDSPVYSVLGTRYAVLGTCRDALHLRSLAPHRGAPSTIVLTPISAIPHEWTTA